MCLVCSIRTQRKREFLEGSVNFQFSDSCQLLNECLLLLGTKSMKPNTIQMTSLIPISLFGFISCKSCKDNDFDGSTTKCKMGALIFLVKCKNKKLKRQDMSDISSDVLLV